MNYTPIGRVRPIHRGAHDPSTAYAALDVVRREDGFASYMARRDVPAGTPLADGEYWGLLSDGGLKAVADASCPAFEECGGAAVCHPVAGYPLEVATLIAPKQAGTGEPSPDNLRRISGWTGAKLTRCGKNLAKSKNSTNITGLYGSALFLGADLKPSATYTLSFVATAGNQLFVNNNISEYQEISTSGNRQSVTFSTKSTISADDYEQYDSEKGWIIFKNAGDLSTPTVFTDVQLELGSTATAYEPYQGDTFTTDFGQTVYGGTLDWNAGVLTVEWGLISSYSGEALPGEWISDRDIYSAGATPTTGAQIAYKLATPTTIQLSPVQIAALAGTNTLYTDCGDTRAAGRSDMTWVTQGILARLAALEAAAVSE